MGGLVARSSEGGIDRASEADPSSLDGGDSISFPLRRDGSEALHRQVARRLRQAIGDGRLRPGVRLPGTRGLARELGIARITVQTAYDQLTAEGYIEVDGRRGTRVSAALPEHGFQTPAPRLATEPVRFPPLVPWAPSGPVTSPAPAIAAQTELGPEWFGLGSLDARGWERLLVRAWRELAAEPEGPAATYAGPLGDDRLRIALADHLAVARGVRCSADDIAITAGSIAALGAIARTWLGPGSVCVMEDPGGEQLRRALGSAGSTVVPAPVDEGGLRVDRLPSRADVVFVTPSWQYPAGGSLTLPRRLALLRWAADVGAIVVEDDCESELRYDGSPLPSLQGLAPDGRVIYVSTFSKVLFPGLRTGYLVVPPAHRGPLLAALEAGARQPAAVEQRALALFLEVGGFQRHVRRLRSIYSGRRDAFVRGLGAAGGGLAVRRAFAGGHLIVRVDDPRWTATALSSALADVGVRVEPLSANRTLPGTDDELVVYISRPDATELTAAARLMARVTADGPRSPIGDQASVARRRRTVGRIPPAR